MTTKRVTEKNIRTAVRRCFKKINTHKEYMLVLLLFIFTCIVLYQITLEKVIIYICSLIAIQFVILKDNKRKIKIKIEKNYLKQ
jgi:hypothetical protein